EAARLIWLVIDEGASSKSVFVNAGTGKPSTFADFSNLVGRHFPDLSIKYSGDDADVPPPMRTGIARSEYGWNSLYSFSDDFPGMVKRITAVPVKRFLFVSKFFNAAGSFFKGSKGFIVLEFIAATVLLHFLSTGLRKFTFSSWIDLRLLFVVILSTLHGTISGIASGIIAGIMLFLSMGSSDWRILVYNPENWIPFALYIILGVSLGSKADRNVDSLKFTEERLALAEQTNVYLVELYDEAVRIKDNYRDQILGYKDNFGRIYTIVKKLNSEMSEYVFSSAIEVLEDVLSNNTIAIYSLSSNGDYARITVSSKNLHGEIARSMRLKDYQRITEKLEQHDIWFNRDLISGYPSYCAPVYNDEKLIAMVMIWRAGVEQMTLHYSNLFRILSGLIQESLVRAVKFNKLRESTSFYPDTRILYKEPFIEAYKANLTLSDQDKAKFCLLTVNRGGEDVNAQNIRLEACIRESDIAGTVNDGLFGIILKNVTNDDIQTLLNRFSSNNLDARQVTIAQMHELVFGEA
ncbi:MAG: hypothetical protein FWH38_02775, partial [Treponema sp.]|nr:hypothetical protein [Treponema sp.]